MCSMWLLGEARPFAALREGSGDRANVTSGPRCARSAVHGSLAHVHGRQHGPQLYVAS